MSEIRRPVAPIRQLSLQPPGPRRCQVRRQCSVENDKSTRFRSNSVATGGDSGDSRLISLRPKARVAWSDERGGGTVERNNSIDHVQVVAQRISRYKPEVKRNQRASGRNDEKIAMLYPRQELTERFRLAWKEREKNKGNIDIFLARGAMANNDSQDEEQETSTADAKAYKSKMNTERETEKKSRTTNVAANSTAEKQKEIGKKMEIISVKDGHEGNNYSTSGCSTNAQIQNVKSSSTKQETQTNPSITKADMSSAKQKHANFRNASNRAFLYLDADAADAGSRSNSVDKTVCARKSLDITKSSGNGSNVTKNSEMQRPEQNAKRSYSAPLQRSSSASSRVQMNIMTETPQNPTPLRKAMSIEQSRSKTAEVDGAAERAKANFARPVRSAPIKRRFKSNKRRQQSAGWKTEDSGESQKLSRSKRKDLLDGKSNEVITMVSLISSTTESDSDLENSSSEAKLIDELKAKLTTIPIIKSSTGPVCRISKSTKSVSFRRDSTDEDSPTKERAEYSSTSEKQLPQNRVTLLRDPKKEELSGWKSNERILPVFSVIQVKSECSNSPLSDREMRGLAVPLGDLEERKKGSNRAQSASRSFSISEKGTAIIMDKRKDRAETANPLATSVVGDVVAVNKCFIAKVNFEEAVTEDKVNLDLSSCPEVEPILQTRKEKDCWQLYKRMCNKGVNVSFDTVLRGMLTPTEYRLRQRECSRNLE